MKEKTMERMRLDKYLAQTAGLTRSEAKQYLKKEESVWTVRS